VLKVRISGDIRQAFSRLVRTHVITVAADMAGMAEMVTSEAMATATAADGETARSFVRLTRVDISAATRNI
jgi:hypothetical protein